MHSKLLKITFTLVLVLFLSGCSARYEITLNNNTIEDNIYISAPSKDVDSLEEPELSRVSDEINDFERGFEFYHRTLDTDSKNTWYQYNYEFNFDDYDAMSQLSKCYDLLEVSNDDGISLTTGKEFLCMDYYSLNEYKIVIKSDYKCMSNNADEISDNTYIWNIDKSNYQNKPILINFSNELIEEKESSSNGLLKLIISVSIPLALILISLFLKRKELFK